MGEHVNPAEVESCPAFGVGAPTQGDSLSKGWTYEETGRASEVGVAVFLPEPLADLGAILGEVVLDDGEGELP